MITFWHVYSLSCGGVGVRWKRIALYISNITQQLHSQIPVTAGQDYILNLEFQMSVYYRSFNQLHDFLLIWPKMKYLPDIRLDFFLAVASGK